MRRSCVLLFATLFFVSRSVPQDRAIPSYSQPSHTPGAAFIPEPQAAQPAALPVEPWQILQRMGVAEHSRATLTIDPGPQAPSAAKVLAAAAAAAWNSGDDAQAVRALYDLGAMVDPRSIELCLSWHDAPPVHGNVLFSGNVRVGTLDSVTSVALASNLDGSRVYALLAHASSSGSMHLYRSTDKGDTWTPTSTVTALGAAPQVAISPLTGSLYVGYFPGAASTTLRVRKFKMESGEIEPFVDGTMTDNVLSIAQGDSLREVAGASNMVYLNTRIYFAMRMHSKRVRFFWSSPTADTLWQEIPELATGGALRGLSASYSYGSLGHRIYLSYVDTLGRVTIDTAGSTGKSFKRVAVFANAGALTSISAYHDSAICAFDYNGPTPEVRCITTSNGGSTWFAQTPIDTTATNESPAVMMEKAQGTALFYRHANGASRAGQIISRWYGPSAVWDTVRTVTDYVPHSLRSGIVALGDRTWGVVYIVNDPVPALQSVFFLKYKAPDDTLRSTFLSFKGKFDQGVDLRWVATGQTNVVRYVVERRRLLPLTADSLWKAVDTISASGARSDTVAYADIDDIGGGGKVAYRIAARGPRSQVLYSNEIQVILVSGASPEPAVAALCELYQNYPNPFNPSTMIRFDLPAEAQVTITVTSVLGQTIAVLVNQRLPPGRHEVLFDAAQLPSGVYFSSMRTGEFVRHRKLLLLK